MAAHLENNSRDTDYINLVNDLDNKKLFFLFLLLVNKSCLREVNIIILHVIYLIKMWRLIN